MLGLPDTMPGLYSLGIKPTASCLADKHSGSYATFPNPLLASENLLIRVTFIES